MISRIRILHLEDDIKDAELIAVTLKASNVPAVITPVRSKAEFEAAMQQGDFDLIISDYTIPGYDGLSALKTASLKFPATPFVFVSGTIGEERAIEALKQGAADYVIKDRPARLVTAIERAVADAEARKKRTEAEVKLREQAELLDRAQDAICLMSLDQVILYWNKSAERLYGWSAGEVLGRECPELLYRGHEKRVTAIQVQLVRDGNWIGEFEQTARDGRKIIVESRWTLVRGKTSEPRGILIINTDITQKKQAENQLLRAQRVQSLGALAGGIAHDLNNCLTPILAGLDLIKPEIRSDIAGKMLDTMQISARRGADMVRQILSFARGVEGEPAPVPLRRIVREIAALAEDTFPPSINIHCRIAPELASVTGNATQINQVLLNLCVNARDAMPEGGELRIEANNLVVDHETARQKNIPPGLYVLLAVADTGHGIAADILERVFEPFFSTKGREQGTGLGLSTVMGIVKTHGGKVEFTTKISQGTTFNVYLPASGRPDTAQSEPVQTEIPRGNGETILLVDDEAAILEIIRFQLESYGYKVITATNGADAVELYREQAPEIAAVVTDVMMPVMDGSKAVRAISQINPGVKIIGMSGLHSDVPNAAAGRAVMSAFLKKPFTTSELLGTLNHLLAA